MTELGNLYDDMEKLDELYTELGWPETDPLTFVIEDDHILIRNLYHEQRQKSIRVCEGHPLDNT